MTNSNKSAVEKFAKKKPVREDLVAENIIKAIGKAAFGNNYEKKFESLKSEVPEFYQPTPYNVLHKTFYCQTVEHFADNFYKEQCNVIKYLRGSAYDKERFAGTMAGVIDSIAADIGLINKEEKIKKWPNSKPFLGPKKIIEIAEKSIRDTLGIKQKAGRGS